MNNDYWALAVIATALVFWLPVAAVVGWRRWRKAQKSRRRKHRVAELLHARERLVKASETLSNKSWPPAGSRRRAEAVRELAPPDVREHISLLIESTARLQSDIARGLEIVEVANRVERLHRHHVHVQELLDNFRRN